MRILEVRVRDVGLGSDIRNAVIDFSRMTATICAVVTDAVVDGRPVVGFGFSSNGRYGQAAILRDRMLPRVLEASPEELVDPESGELDPLAVQAIAMHNEKPGGHGERSVASGVLDMALWDALAKKHGTPLYRILADRFHDGRCDPEVEVYAAGGYYHPGKDERALQDELRSYLDRGYSRVKMKVGGAPLTEDIARIEAALEVTGSGERLMVDANARFGVDEGVAFAQAIEPHELHWYEEPCDPLDYAALAEIAHASTTPLATGENLFSAVDVRNLLRYGGLDPERDTLQMDPVLSYGLPEYLRMLDDLESAGWSRRRCVPHGGHQFALHIAAGLGIGAVESYPDVFAPFGGFGERSPVWDGRLTVSETPGIGFRDKPELMALFEDLLETES